MKNITQIQLITILFFSLNIIKLNAQNASVTIDKNPKIDELIRIKKEVSLDNVFKIQIFKCESTKESDCKVQKKRFENLFKDTPAKIEWITPTFRVRVGKYRTKLEAEYALSKIKKEFENAFVL